ncbi:PLD nuclease N-terminal domain-containing protein [Luteolibacter arcticus]|uniref:PLD nuclease N-terminal domain-containing protein n=1 Tax=Luteolibacter arcticus TaxID=1581411 RepID=UPI0034E09605
MDQLCFVSGLGGQELAVICFLLFPLILSLVALIQCLSANFPQGSEKIVWVIVLLALPILGPILWWTIGTKKTLK